MNKYNTKNFFNEEEKIKIEDTIKDIEKKTSGEIVVMVVGESFRYHKESYITAFVLSILLSAMTIYLLPEIILNIFHVKESFIETFFKIPFGVREELRYFLTFGIWIFIVLEIIFYLLAKLLLNTFPWIKVFFIPSKVKKLHVQKKAFNSFYEKGLYKTRDETGVLFLFSLLEKKVYLLADKGIYEKITQETLDKYAKEISNGVKTKNTTDALITCIKKVGELLEKNFPIKPDDTNELPNHIIIE